MSSGLTANLQNLSNLLSLEDLNGVLRLYCLAMVVVIYFRELHNWTMNSGGASLTVVSLSDRILTLPCLRLKDRSSITY